MWHRKAIETLNTIHGKKQTNCLTVSAPFYTFSHNIFCTFKSSKYVSTSKLTGSLEKSFHGIHGISGLNCVYLLLSKKYRSAIHHPAYHRFFITAYLTVGWTLMWLLVHQWQLVC